MYAAFEKSAVAKCEHNIFDAIRQTANTKLNAEYTDVQVLMKSIGVLGVTSMLDVRHTNK